MFSRGEWLGLSVHDVCVGRVADSRCLVSKSARVFCVELLLDFDLVVRVETALEISNRLTDPVAELRQAACSEYEHDDCEHEYELSDSPILRHVISVVRAVVRRHCPDSRCKPALDQRDLVRSREIAAQLW